MCADSGKAARSARGADIGTDGSDEGTGFGIDHIQPANAVGIVVAGRKQYDPGAIFQLGNLWIAIAVSEAGVGELPKQDRRSGIGNIQRIVAVASAIQAADQDGFPLTAAAACRGCIGADVSHFGRAVDIKLMLR